MSTGVILLLKEISFQLKIWGSLPGQSAAAPNSTLRIVELV